MMFDLGITIRTEFKLQELMSKFAFMSNVVTKVKITGRHFGLETRGEVSVTMFSGK